jgi:hypothetical protein
MYAFTHVEPRLSDPVVSAARRNRRRRRLYFRLRNFGRAVVSGMIRIRTGLLEALHDSRSRAATRVIDQHRHLLWGLPTDERGSLRGRWGSPSAANRTREQ